MEYAPEQSHTPRALQGAHGIRAAAADRVGDDVGPTGVVNAAPFSFFNVFCEDPPLCMFAVNLRPDGRAKERWSTSSDRGVRGQPHR